MPAAAPAAASPAAQVAAGAVAGASGAGTQAGNPTAQAAQAALKVAAASQGLPATSVPATVEGSRGDSALTVEGPTDVKVGDEFEVSVHLATDQNITHLRSQLRYDATALELVSATPGDMVPAAAGAPKVETHAGGAQLDVTTTSDSPVQGNGTLMVLRFKALALRPATSVLAMLNVLGGVNAAVGNASSAPLKIAIQQ